MRWRAGLITLHAKVKGRYRGVDDDGNPLSQGLRDDAGPA